jgi:hypothetical protein
MDNHVEKENAMTPQQKYSPSEGEVLESTDARQASPRKMNFRVLLGSLTLAAIVGIVLVAGFWSATPTSMDYSSGGKLSQQGPTPEATVQPSSPTTPGAPTGAPQTAPAAPTPPTPPTTP